jgi:hypothetical protein
MTIDISQFQDDKNYKQNMLISKVLLTNALRAIVKDVKNRKFSLKLFGLMVYMK